MSYSDRVQAMCDQLDIPNPIQEDDLRVKSLTFTIRGAGWAVIEGTDMNRAGRLFFQFHVDERYAHHNDDDSGKITQLGTAAVDRLKVSAQEHFGEMWDDAEEKGRLMLAAFKQAIALEVHWKP